MRVRFIVAVASAPVGADAVAGRPRVLRGVVLL